MKLRAYLPCVLAFLVILPLVATSFVIWFVFYDRAISIAEDSGQLYLNRTAAEMGKRIEQALSSTDNLAFSARNVLVNFLPWTLVLNETVFDKPQVLMYLNSLRSAIPSYVFAVACATEGGVLLSTFQRTVDAWGFVFQEQGFTPLGRQISFWINSTGFDEDDNTAFATFRPNTTFESLRSNPNLQFTQSAPYPFRNRSWYVDGLNAHARGVYSGWTLPFETAGGPHSGELGAAAWFGLSMNREEPYAGVCQSNLYLGDLHSFLRSASLGEHGLAILIDNTGIVIASSRIEDAGGGVNHQLRPVHVCEAPAFAIACAEFRLRDASADATIDAESNHSTLALLSSDRSPNRAQAAETTASRGDLKVSLFPMNSRAFRGYFIFIGRPSDFDGQIRKNRNTAVGVSVVVLVVAAVSVALVSYFFSRPMVVVSSMLTQISHATDEHTRKLDRDGVVHALPEEEWRKITKQLDSALGSTIANDEPLQHADAPTNAGAGAINGRPPDRARSADAKPSLSSRARQRCDQVVLGRWGGPEVKQLQASLLAMISSLTGLARKATEQEQLRRKFIRFIFHEVRVPLHSMALALAQMPPDVVESETCRILQEQCDAVTDLLTDVLTLDKMEEGHFELELRPACLECLVHSTCRIFVPSARSKGLRFVLRTSITHSSMSKASKSTLSSDLTALHTNGSSASLPLLPSLSSAEPFVQEIELSALQRAPSETRTNHSPIPSSSHAALDESCTHSGAARALIDPLRMRQVLRNLLSNAFKFTMEGSVTVHLRVDTDASVIEVTDTGIGLDEDSLSKLFRPYVQFANDLQKGQGSGLGLSISKRLAQLHGGDLLCFSRSGVGSTFVVQLPLTTEVADRQSVDDRDSVAASSIPLSRAISNPFSSPDAALRPLVEPPLTTVASSPSLPTRGLTRDASVQRYIDICHKTMSSGDTVITAADHGPMLQTESAVSPPASINTSPKSVGARPSENKQDTLTIAYDSVSSLSALQDSSALSLNPSTGGASQSQLPCGSSGTLTALVVDDTALNVKLLCRLLEKRGWATQSAQDGVEACRHVYARQHQFQVIFMDRSMPVMDGPEAVRRIRGAGFPGFIVGLTGDISSEVIKEFSQAGANMVIAKPIEVRKLDSILQQCCETPPAQTQCQN